MKRTTRKLSGRSLDRFFRLFFRRQPGLDQAQADHLARISAKTISSAQVRTVALNALRASSNKARSSAPAAARTPAEPPSGSGSIAAVIPGSGEPPIAAADGKAATAATPARSTEEPQAGAPSSPEPLPAAGPTPGLASAPPPAGPFDPYIFGLVPIYQRQGPDGLMAKLAEITHIDHLRRMAKAQQILLPAELRSGDADARALRAGIVAAVGKRIADRRAAAS
jgi:hypothetical protein